MNKLTGKEIVEILLKNYTLENIGFGEWLDTEQEIQYPPYLKEKLSLYNNEQDSLRMLKRDSEEYKNLAKIASSDPYEEIRDYILNTLKLGKIENIEQVGGEGEGETYYQVWYFVNHDVYIRINGFYTSYEGTDWNNNPYVVTPQEKTITVYE